MTTPTHAQGCGTLPLTAIILNDRLRRDTPQDRIEIERDIVPSIADHGLIHPILVNVLPEPITGQNYLGETITSQYVLIAGWSRLISFSLLNYPEIPYNTRSSLSDEEAESLELEENIRRREMRWQDVALGIERIYNRRVAKAPPGSKAVEWGVRQTGYLVGVEASSVKRALLYARYIRKGDKEICDAASPAEVERILLKRVEDEALKALHDLESNLSSKKLAAAKKKLEKNAVPSIDGKPQIKFVAPSSPPDPKKVTEVPLYSRIFNLDCFDFMASQPEESFDLCYTDPPFAIPMSNLEELAEIEVIRESHDVSENLDQMERFFPALYRIMRPDTYSFVWYDIRHQEKIFGSERRHDSKWKRTKGWAEKAGFKIQPYPCVWIKTHACKNNAAGQHFTKSFEYVMVLRKGTPTLASPQLVGHKEASNAIERKQQKNPFSKPWDFSEWLLKPVAKPGMKAIDLYAGGGSLVRHMLNLGLDVYATEKDPEQFPHLIESIKSWHENAVHGKVEFI